MPQYKCPSCGGFKLEFFKSKKICKDCKKELKEIQESGTSKDAYEEAYEEDSFVEIPSNGSNQMNDSKAKNQASPENTTHGKAQKSNMVLGNESNSDPPIVKVINEKGPEDNQTANNNIAQVDSNANIKDSSSSEDEAWILVEPNKKKKKNAGPKNSKQKKIEKQEKKSEKVTHIISTPTSEPSEKTQTQSKTTVLDTFENYEILFHIFVSPEFKIDPKTCKIGIYTSSMNWREPEMITFKSIREFKNGYIVAGSVKISSESMRKYQEIEYKWLIMVPGDQPDEKFYLVEFLRPYTNRRLNLSSILKSGVKVHNRYDGILQPPDENTNSSWKSRFKSYFKSFYAYDMVQKYLNSTIEAMLYELNDEISKIENASSTRWSFHDLTGYLSNIYDNLYSFYNLVKCDSARETFFFVAVQMITRGGHRKMSYLEAVSILYLIGRHFNNRYHQFNSLYNVILRSIAENDASTDFYSLFGPKETRTLNVTYLNNVYDHIMPSLDSLYILKLLIYLEFDDVVNQFPQFYNSRDCHDYFVDFSKKKIYNNRDQYFEAFSKALEDVNMKDACVLQKALFLPSFLEYSKLPASVFMKVFSSEHYISFLRVCLRQADADYWQRADFYKNLSQDHKEALVKLLNRSLESILRREQNSFGIQIVDLLSGDIIGESYKVLNKFSNYDRYLELRTLLTVMKANAYCESINRPPDQDTKSHENQSSDKYKNWDDFKVKIIDGFNDILILLDSDIDYKRFKVFGYWSLLYDIYDHSFGYFKDQLNKRIIMKHCWESISRKKIPDLIKICKILVEKQKDINVHPSIEKLAFEAIKINVDKISSSDMNDLLYFSEHNFSQLSYLADEIIDKKWPANENEHDLFNFIFECFNFLRAFFLIDEKSLNKNIRFETKITQIVSLLDYTLKELISGEIKISIINNLKENEEKLINLCQLFKNIPSLKTLDNESISKLVKNLLVLRLKEIKDFQNFHQLMRNFLKFLQSNNQIAKKVMTDEFSRKLSIHDKIDGFRLNDLVICQKADNTQHQGTDIRSFEEVPTEYVKLIETLIRISPNNTLLFYFIREKSIITSLPKQLEINKFIIDVLLPAYNEDYMNLCKQIANGSLVLDKFEEFAIIQPNLNKQDNKTPHDKWKENFRVLMKSTDLFNDQLIEKRFQQFQYYLRLSNLNEIVRVLTQVKSLNQLTARFDFLEDLENSVGADTFREKQVKEIDEKSMRMTRTLEDFSDVPFIKCLSKYCENYEFVEWIRQNTRDVNALKILCELASESENEGALEVVRVQSLSLVGTAYSPLIYAIKPDISYEEFIKLIRQVHENFKKNPNMPDKIESISKEKSWLEDIKEAKGNTEANSLKQAERINKRGIYDISLRETEIKHDLDLDDIIRLKVPANLDQKEQEKSYTYSQLIELNDKLTLVVGKEGKQQEIIKYFSDILQGVINMGSEYINLLKTGNILFQNWTTTVYCSSEAPNTIKVNFGVRETNENIIGIRQAETSTINSINRTIKFLKRCNSEWLEHLNEKRKEFAEFNYYKTSQISKLRGKIAEFIRNSNVNDLDKELADLLNYLNRDVTYKMLKAANNNAFEALINQSTKEENNSGKSDDSMEESEKNAYLELENLDFPRALIKRAIDACKTFEVDKLMPYCIENLVNEEKKDDYSDKSHLVNFDKVKSGFLSKLHGDAYENDDDEGDEKSTMKNTNTLEKKYDEIWRAFCTYLDCNFEHCVSLNHLGRVLRYVKEQSKLLIRRSRPNYLEYSTANLIVCPRDEIIKRVLSIYEQSADQPLPSDDEVLYCNGETSFEEIELFWYRVLLNKDSKEEKIYSLVNVQDLSYDQAVKAQTAFEKLLSIQTSDKPFTLCIICSLEKEDKSVFASAFSRHRKNIPLSADIELKLREYLSAHFKTRQTNENLLSIEKDDLSVRVITSDRAGTGKSLYIKRLIERFKSQNNKIKSVCISVKKQTLPFETVFNDLKKFEETSDDDVPRIYHIDVAYEVWYEVDYFLFNLMCLSVIKSKSGALFRRRPNDFFFVEIMAPKFRDRNDRDKIKPLHSILTILPSLNCLTPVQVLNYITESRELPDDVCPLLFDQVHLKSELIQRPCQYLQIHDMNGNFDNFEYNPAKMLNARTCLELLLRHLEHGSPSWSEIMHFASFLNTQLTDSENSAFCQRQNSDILPGFKTFVVKFMIQMSHDFALPSLQISDCSALRLNEQNQQAEFNLEQLNMRRKWENDPHPYLFFNPDGHTFTFFGINVNKANGQLVDPRTSRVLFDSKILLNRDLIQGLDLQNRNILTENIERMTKVEKIQKLLYVMGIEWATHSKAPIVDPDPSYELTMDNLLKILAIYMRLRANIPVIIMGETGCGKTRLCKYMCELQKNPNAITATENMYLVKVHGGTTSEEIRQHVKAAQKLAKNNSENHPGMFTVLFFDEANSTEAIGTIKEIMCDSRIDGQEIEKNTGLKIIAACNPYKKHSDDIIKKFEESGLGFYIDMNETQEKLGDLPMRHLVYRVQPLPASMMPIIWDFGQLGPQVERLYINQIVTEKFNNKLTMDRIELIANLLATSQAFMKNLKNECSFVSLRDIQRVLKVIDWFLNKGQKIFNQINKKNSNRSQRRQSISNQDVMSTLTVESEENHDNDDDEENEDVPYYEESEEEQEELVNPSVATINPITPIDSNENLLASIILALNACYHVGLQTEESRTEYRQEISKSLRTIFSQVDENYIAAEINYCYEVFLDEIHLPDAIARNQALKENIFMMLICVELKIPLFIIGKPGSSKSLAKNLISFKMQGSDRLVSPVLSSFKEAQLITFQCSPMSTSEMILNTFRYCAKYQHERMNDLDRYTSVVVLDEIGLAEASSSMPLKALHPLLEDGVHFDEEEEKSFSAKKAAKTKGSSPAAAATPKINEDWHRVGFIGISNWCLDPAKMNRGIFVNRNSPTINELKETVVGICKNDKTVLKTLEEMRIIDSLSKAYLTLCEKARSKTREFFGLRDFYSLVKMIYWHIKENNANGLEDFRLEWRFLEKVIRRNFGGLIDIDPLNIFVAQFTKDRLPIAIGARTETNIIDLIKEALLKKTTEDENRYLLLLSQNDNALDLINNFILNEFDDSQKGISNTPNSSSNIKIIFGSSFPNDQKYSEICRKIHQIKLSMEMGKTVVLLNLENLYESLYDALNQFYYKFSDDEKFVDLGLGTARVKCLVHNEFRLIIVADKKSVYNPKKYPIPLVNRLEKHLLKIEYILNDKMKRIVERISKWCNDLTAISEKYGSSRQANPRQSSLKPTDVFIGFTDETIPSIVYRVCKEHYENEMLSDSYDASWEQCMVQVEFIVKQLLIQSSTSDGIIRLSQITNSSNISSDNIDANFVIDMYYNKQRHESFVSFFKANCFQPNLDNPFIQVTTHSKLIYSRDIEQLKRAMTSNEEKLKIRIESLLSFDTQQQFVQVLREFFESAAISKSRNALIIQCECGHFYQELITCARFAIIDEYSKYLSECESSESNKPILNKFHVILIIQIPKIAGGCLNGFQTSKWYCYHIDDVQDNLFVGNILAYKDKSLGEIFKEAATEKDDDNYSRMFTNMLRSVIYVACSKVINEKRSNQKDRSIKRIEILIDLLRQKPEFAKILIKHIAELQLEREQILQVPTTSKNWLFNEVSKISSVIKYGTLRNSCQNYMETRLCHLFTGLIALIDANHNLDLLVKPASTHLADFWLHIFTDAELIDLTYRNYLLSNNIEKTEFICPNLVSNAANTDLQLPFSWLIKQKMDELINLKIKDGDLSTRAGDHNNNEEPNRNDSYVEMFKQLESAFQASRVKEQLDHYVSSDEFIEAYLNDYLLLSAAANDHSFVSESHLNVIRNRIKAFATSVFGVVDLVSVTFTYAILKNELNLFTKFVSFNPTIATDLENKEMAENLSYLAAYKVTSEHKELNLEMKANEWNEWLENMNIYRELIELVLLQQKATNAADDEKKQSLRSFWERVSVIKYFIEDLCKPEIVQYKLSYSLWNSLGSNANLKKIESFKKVISYVDIVNRLTRNNIENQSEKCKGCDQTVLDSLFEAKSCENSCRICEGCMNESISTGKCAKCTKNLNGERFVKIEVKNSFNQRNKLCKIGMNRFFMDVVQNLCFDQTFEQLPDEEVINTIIKALLPQKLDKTQQMTFDLSLSPSVKSTLFQLLLNYNQSKVEAHLNEIFVQSEEYLRSRYKVEDITNLKLMYVNSIEDSFYANSSTRIVDKTIELLSEVNDQIALFEDGEEENSSEISRLKCLAKIRFCLVSFAKLIVETDEKDLVNLTAVMKQFIEQISDNGCLWVKFFLIKDIFRKYGNEAFKKLAQNDLFKWILPENISDDEQNSSDYFLVCGDEYKNLKNAIKDALLSNDFEKLINKIEPTNRGIVNCSLALFKEVSLCKNLLTNEAEKCKNLIEKISSRFNDDTAKKHFEMFLDSTRLGIYLNQDRNRQISMLLVHLYSLFGAPNQDLGVLNVFKQISEQPNTFLNSYLPSIAHDDDFEVFESFNTLHSNETPAKFYQCPKGHFYSIGNCTQPAVTLKCPTCKEDIGGAGHVLAAGNKPVDQLESKNELGYFTNPDQQQAENIREMGFVNTSLTRLLLECALYLASLTNSRDVLSIVREEHNKPSRDDEVSDFFYARIEETIKRLANHLQISPDDCLLFVHFVLRQSIITATRRAPVNIQLGTKPQREAVEKELCEFVNRRVLGPGYTVDKLVEQFTNVLKDEAANSGSDLLFRIAFDLVEPVQNDDEDDDALRFLNQKAFWQFRKQITLKSFVNSFNTFLQNRSTQQQVEYQLLNKFLQQLDNLKVIKHLPRLLKMVRILHSTFNRQLDKQTSSNLILSELIETNAALSNNQQAIFSGARSFIKLWSKLSSSISSKLSSRIVSRFKKDTALDHQMWGRTTTSHQANDNDSVDNRHKHLPLCYLLPASYGDGIYLYALIFYLIDINNEFVRFYDGLRGRANDERVDLDELQESHCICVSVKRELLNIIFINSNYTLERVRELNFEFNYDKIQQTVDQKFLFGKKPIDTTNIPVIEFSDSINDLSRFERLNKRIKQMELSYAQKEKISQFYKTPNSLNDVIRKLHIVIDFIISSGFSKDDVKIMDYAVNVLKMSGLDESDTNKQVNELETVYLESLWNLLSLRRVILLTEHNQDPFDQLDEIYRVQIRLEDIDSQSSNNDELTAKEIEQLVIDHIKKKKNVPNLENLSNLLDFIYKFIVYKLIPLSTENNGDDDENQTFNGEHEIIHFLNAESMEISSTRSIEFNLDEFNLEKIRLKNVHQLWRCFVKIFLDIRN